ncbi:MAG: ADP-ribosyltransferase [Deltaproteobacteria bacterium]|jgi:hypothetical protein|nr:ADP-ribosyltransferase [Deltaproteobacteria bacterium]
MALAIDRKPWGTRSRLDCNLNLPDGIREALDSYTFDGKDKLINSALRKSIESESALKMARIIDTAIEIGTQYATEPVTIYRGIGNSKNIFDKLNNITLKNLKPSMKFNNRSLLSCSQSEKVARKFAEGNYGIMWVLKTNKGLPITSLSYYKKELEYLMKSDLNFKVVNKY